MVNDRKSLTGLHTIDFPVDTETTKSNRMPSPVLMTVGPLELRSAPALASVSRGPDIRFSMPPSGIVNTIVHPNISSDSGHPPWFGEDHAARASDGVAGAKSPSTSRLSLRS